MDQDTPEFKPIRAPWTPEQVEGLNRWQMSDYVHPYTCGSGYRTNKDIHPDGEGKLVATANGWVCPNCDYTQDWAHEFSVEPPPNPLAGSLPGIG
jgi:hypothetical protein